MMSGWAQRDAEEREDREDEILKLDAMLNAAIEAAGLDPHKASVDDLIAWIRERRAEEWQDISTAPKDREIMLWEPRPELKLPNYPGSVHLGYWDRDVFVDDQKNKIPSTHWRPLPKGPKA